MARPDLQDIVTIDFEASSLDPASWPVEVGLSWILDDEVRSWSSLIRPAPDWSMDAWNPASEEVHGITRAELDAAPPAFRVAGEVLDRIAGRQLVSDAPEFDQRWLNCLVAEAADPADPLIRDFDAVAFELFDGLALDGVYERLERITAPHRAGPDSARLARGLLAGLAPVTRFTGDGPT